MTAKSTKNAFWRDNPKPKVLNSWLVGEYRQYLDQNIGELVELRGCFTNQNKNYNYILYIAYYMPNPTMRSRFLSGLNGKQIYNLDDLLKLTMVDFLSIPRIGGLTFVYLMNILHQD